MRRKQICKSFCMKPLQLHTAGYRGDLVVLSFLGDLVVVFVFFFCVLDFLEDGFGGQMTGSGASNRTIFVGIPPSSASQPSLFRSIMASIVSAETRFSAVARVFFFGED